jgi:hypothetical protein
MSPQLLDIETGPRPGPIPSLDRIYEEKADKSPGNPPSGLETGFKVLLFLSVPFIAYVLSWRAGFHLATVAYAVLAVVMLAAAILRLEHVGNRVPEVWATAVNASTHLRWVSLQTIPLVGFELWRHAAPGSIYELIPLLVITWAFIAMVGTPGSLPNS